MKFGLLMESARHTKGSPKPIWRSCARIPGISTGSCATRFAEH
jgi:hypothetical protein